MQVEFLPVLFGGAIKDGDYRLELAHLPGEYYGTQWEDGAGLY